MNLLLSKKNWTEFNFSFFSVRTEVRFGRFVSAYYTRKSIYKYCSFGGYKITRIDTQLLNLALTTKVRRN